MCPATPAPLAVMIADDHAMVRAGLQRIIDGEPGLRVVAQAENGSEVLARLRETQCDVLLLDLTMPPPNGSELIGMLRAQWPKLPILIVSMHNNPKVVRAALRAGASGYVPKDSEPDTLMLALRRVAAGEHYVEPGLANALLFPSGAAEGPHEKLSPREMQVLRRLAAGRSNNEIAREFNLSEKTIGTNKANLMLKLGLDNMADLVRYADEHLLPEEGPAP